MYAWTMNKLAGDSESRQHSLSDWLALHELDQAICHRLLDDMTWQAGEPAARNKSKSGYQAPDLDVAWLTTAEAMRDFLPEQQGIIDDTFEKTAKIVVGQRDKSGRAITLDNGPTAYPTILYSYRGEPTDPLVIAHEFAHALQIMASRGKFVPPIMREVCAFLGESALLRHTLQRNAVLYPYFAQAWQDHNSRYFGPQRDRLQAALSRPDSSYTYSWNYPIARYLAMQIVERCSPDWIWRVFEGETSVREALQELGIHPGSCDRDE
jgi:hypothetical protein